MGKILYWGKRSLLTIIKSRVVTNISIAIFRFNHKSFSSKESIGRNCKITSDKTYLYPRTEIYDTIMNLQY